MHKMALPTLAAALLVLSTNGPASANFTFNVVNVTMTEFGLVDAAGTLSGSFTTNDKLDTLLSANITASSATISSGFTYPGFTYTLANLKDSRIPQQLLQFGDGSGLVLRLTFDGGLTASGAKLMFSSPFSYEFENGHTRNIVTGSVVAASAVPEPSSLALCGIAGASGLIAAGVRRKRTTG